MEGRCAVETWTEFHCPSPATAVGLLTWSGTELLVCTGREEVHVFNTQELKLTAVLQFPLPVSHLVQSEDKQLLYVVCEREGVYCVPLASLLPRTSSSSSANRSPDPLLLKVSSDWLAVADEDVRSLILVDGTLLILSLRESVWWFTLYKTSSSPSSSSSSTPGHQKLAEFSLPAIPVGLHDDWKENTGKRRVVRPVLACVHSGDASPTSSSSSSSSSPPQGDGHFLLAPLLFKLLFGVDSALIPTPIILCGLPDGRLCFLPLRLPGQRVRVLHGLDQPVAFVGGGGVAQETGGGGARCVVAVGGRGRVLLVQAREAGPEEGGVAAGFTEGSVAGPVVCVCAGRDCLYYSTGSDLQILGLPGGGGEQPGPGEGEVPGGGESPGQGQQNIQSPRSLNVCRVIALAGPSHTPSGAVQLVALSSRGRLQRLTLPQGSEQGGLPRLPSSQVGQRVRDLLAAIGDVFERASVLKGTVQSRNHTLRHLNQVLNISCLLLAYQSDGERPPAQERPIRCGVVARWSRLLQRDSLTLTCVLDNRSAHVLERGWTLCVRVLPLSPSLAAGGENASRTFSFPLRRLEPAEKTEVSLPLTTADDTRFPVTVSCSLAFSLQSLLGQEELARLLANGDPALSALGLDGSGCISLALDMLTVDWLDAVQVDGTAPAHSVSMDTVSADTVQSYLSSRGFRRAGRGDGGGGGGGGGEAGLFSARVRVSSELLRSALGPGQMTSPGLGGSVLDWLLSQGPGGQERRGPGSPLVYARAPGGHRVKLTASEVTVAEGVLAVVEVKVESFSMAAVCGLHHAVLRRVQVLFQSAPGKCLSSVREQDLGLRQRLQLAEALLEQIQESRIPEAFGPGAAPGRATETLLRVYRQIRENPLLIT